MLKQKKSTQSTDAVRKTNEKMSRIYFVVAVLFVLLVSSKYTEGSPGPEQVHLSYSGK